jgi:LuxR family transcriptional regulator, maltose regulon positive regulatory protein
MDSSLELARSAKSPPASLSGASYEPAITLANNAKEPEEMRHLGVRLSARERTIVLLMGHGLSNKRIARQLSIAPETVKSHAKNLFLKLTVQSRAQAVYRASTLGLI